MTERRESYTIPRQLGLFSASSPLPDLSYRERVALILEHYPEARDDDALLLFHYWHEFDGLSNVMDAETLDRFRTWLQKRATSPETIRRRRQEIQKNRYPVAGSLLPTPTEAERRRARDGGGPPRGRW